MSRALKRQQELLAAIDAKDRKKVKRLTYPGVGLNWPVPPTGVLPVVHAARSGDVDFCDFLMGEGAYTECVLDEWPLFNAIRLGFTDRTTLETLIAVGCGLNWQSEGLNDARTCLHYAISLLKFDAVPILLEAGADINQADYNDATPIHTVCEKFDSTCNLNVILDYFLLKPHIKPKPNLNPVNEDGYTPLMCAAGYKNIDAVNRLIKEGVKNLNYISRKGNTALQLAIKSGSEEILLALLRAGCAVNDVTLNSKHQSLLSCAVSENNTTFCRILMEHGANIKPQEHLLHLAAENKNPDMIDLFVEAGLSVNEQERGVTPLMCAARSSAVACRRLIQHGAQMEIVDKMKKTALQYSLDGPVCKNAAIYLIIEGSPRSKLTYKTVERSSDGLGVLLLRFLLLTEISPLKNILDGMKRRPTAHCVKELQPMSSCLHSLQHLSRLYIREALIRHAGGRGILSSVEKLPLPTSIKSYLGYEEELQEAQLTLFCDEDGKQGM